jgi:pheromone shutdown-related protein TraB
MTEGTENLTRIQLEDKEIILIGTAHVSKLSAEQVKEVIETEKPDSVCIELDEPRYQSLMDGNKWKETDIFKVIKEKKASLLLINLALSSFQKRMAKQLGTNVGQEMLQGIESAQEIEANLVLADRDIQITFSRIWHNIGFWGKVKLLMEIIVSIFDDESISDEELEKMKSQDMLNAMLQEFAVSFPKLKAPLIDERNEYLAQKIKEAPGNKIVAVLGAAHVPGIIEELPKEHDLAQLTQLPPKSKITPILGWSIPLLIVALMAYTFYTNPSAGIQQGLSWVLWTGTLSALGTALAFGHPLAILTAFVAAPISALHPLIAAGWFAGLVQAYFRRPNVGDFETLSEDVLSVKGFWNNKVTRVLLIVVFANIGSATGSIIGGADIARLFLQNL